ncbi:hypothetical protein BOX15_Mlig015683g1 [Macrostomum lignano]|uniref:Uncharacterized protein n=1 Tax=Macrostomum lignano TaxID=282301 RepID=A0A267DFU9_9PLAT|nr:hypothetical protein BOX15_Mlig015683g1 [Macrostomum lignano]
MTASRLYQKLYTGGLFSALALAIIACVTPGWGVVWDPRYGTTTSRMLALDGSVNGRAVIAMALIGTICLSISLLANVLTMAVKSLNDSNVPSIISFSALALGGGRLQPVVSVRVRHPGRRDHPARCDYRRQLFRNLSDM